MAIVSTITLNQNKITAALFNMIISQRVFDNKVASTTLADKFRVDGTLFGDTKLYHSFDIGSPEDWLDDAEAEDLLKLNRNKSGKTQSITMGVYKIISVTVDQYLSKQAFMLEGTFAEYTSFLTGSLRKIKRVYDRSLINNKIGTLSPSTSRCDISIVTPKGATIEETNRLEAQTIASRVRILKADLEDNNRDFNSLGYLRSYDPNEFIAIWNVDFSSKITKLDLPTIFHKDFIDKFAEYTLPSRYFGKLGVVDSSKAQASDGVTYRSLIEQDVTLVEALNFKGKTLAIGTKFHLFAGDVIPNKIQVATTSEIKVPFYVEDSTIALKIIHKEDVPYMSGFEAGTEFVNGRALLKTDFLTWGHNTLTHLHDKPLITIRAKEA